MSARSYRILGILGLTMAAALLVGSAALAQLLTFPQRPKPEIRQGPSGGQMLVQADEIQYDNTNERVSAVGNVQIYYKGSTLEANRVTYDQKTRHLRAEGNARLTEANGLITLG
jgi:LPS-assembly protein